MEKVYIAKGNLLDFTQWEIQYIDSIYKSEDNHIVTENEFENLIEKAGNTWSYELMRKFAPAQWITIRGTHVLVKRYNKNTKDEHARIVFAPKKSGLEHLKIIPKTSKEYKELEETVEKQKEKKKDYKKVKELSPKEKARIKEFKKQRLEEKREIKHELIDYIKDVANLSEEQEEKLDLTLSELPNTVSKLKKKADKKLEKRLKNKDLESLMGDVKEKGEGVKKKAIEELGRKADEFILDTEIEKATGEVTDPDKYENIKIDTGDKLINEKIKHMRLDYDEALEISKSVGKYKKALKDVDKKYRDEIKHPRKHNKEVTDMTGYVKVDWSSDDVPDEKVLKDVMQKYLNKLRAEENAKLYNLFDQKYGKKSMDKALDNGVLDTTNAIANIVLNGKGVSRDLVEFIGSDNAARIIAKQLVNKKGKNKALKELTEFMETRGQEVVIESNERTKEFMKTLENYDKLRYEGTYLSGTVSAAMARQHADLIREVGSTVGSLEATAAVLDVVRDYKEGSIGDIIVEGGKDLNRLKRTMENMGIDTDIYKIKKDGSQYNVNISVDDFDKLTNTSTMSEERDQLIADIKSGRTYDKNWLPDGLSGEAYNFVTPAQYKKMSPEKQKQFEAYRNKKGEAGYNIEHKDGAKLYRSKFNVKLKPSQQKMIQFGLTQKRAVMNLGAGTGKTLGFLSLAANLKEQGKLKGNFAFHTMPSRLSDEFYKDALKFTPNLRVANLDKVKSLDKKMELLDAAKAGKYDMVISGHDSMKMQPTAKAVGKIRDRLKQEYTEKMAEQGVRITPSMWRKDPELKAMDEKWTKQYKKSYADMIKSYNPSMVTVDEAHEAFKDQAKKSSQRFDAVKTLADGTEYFIPATGTVSKNNIAELSSLLNITRPDLIPNANEHARQYENINQNTTAFRESGVEAFARSYDNAMLTEKLDVVNPKGEKVKMKENVKRIKLTDYQKKSIRRVEETYHNEKNIKSGTGILNKETLELVKGKDGQIMRDAEKKLGQVYNDKGTMTKSARNFLKSKGFDPDKYEPVPFGRRGASARRDSRTDKILHSGDWKKNAKIQSVIDDFDKHYKKGEKQIIFYDRKDSLPALKAAFAEKYGMEYNKNMFHIDGDVNMGNRPPTKKNPDGGGRNWKVSQFNNSTEPTVIFANSAGKTGLNMQGGNVVHWFSRDNAAYRETQGNARAFRTGQDKDVEVYYHDSETLLDDRKRQLNQKKRRYIDAIRETPEKPVTISDEIIASRERLKERGIKKSVKIITRI